MTGAGGVGGGGGVAGGGAGGGGWLFSLYIKLMIVFVVGMSILELVKNKYYKKHWGSYGLFDRFLLVALVFFHNFLYYILYFTIFFVIYIYFSKRGTRGTRGTREAREAREASEWYRKSKLFIALYLLLCILLLLHWRTNNNMCQFTVWQNRYMKIADDEGFRDPYNVFNDIYFYKDHPYKRERGEIYRWFIFASIAFCIWSLLDL